MAKVFTITPGLENMGALKTGGQGSVYKGRRIGEIITAIKLMPTPIYSESEDDKNYRDFQNEVNKLKKVNEEPNPNVVKILSSGLSDTGNFPFIEMEYIEGPDLEELLQPPHEKVFTIKEVIKVAEHLSNAIAHCHKQDIKHGDIKSNNVKYNVHTGNYMLLDFGLAILTDEQRRTSLRKAGAVEFMAPEQNEGLMLCETDVYSFGVVLFELIGGSVPFPLENKGETARNNVRLSHLETLPPDLMALRKENLPAEWPEDKKDREMKVPEWLINLVYKCLKKKPENRFANGMELHDFVIHNGIHNLERAVATNYVTAVDAERGSEPVSNSNEVKLYKEQLDRKEKELDQMKALLRAREGEVEVLQTGQTYTEPAERGVSKSWFIGLLILTIGLACFTVYSFMNSKNQVLAQTQTSDTTQTQQALEYDTAATTTAVTPGDTAGERKKADALRKKHLADSIKNVQTAAAAGATPQTGQANDDSNADEEVADKKPATTEPEKPKSTQQYMVVNKAYFYNSPDENTRRAAYIKPANDAIVNALEEQNGFIFVSFTNTSGQVTKGWISKKDLQQINE